VNIERKKQWKLVWRIENMPTTWVTDDEDAARAAFDALMVLREQGIAYAVYVEERYPEIKATQWDTPEWAEQ